MSHWTCITCSGTWEREGMFRVNKRTPTGKCRECVRTERREKYWRDPEKAKRYAAQWKAANRDRLPHYGRRSRYGMEPEEYEALRHRQGDACAICGKCLPLKVDHSHATGAIRGLLCDRCNRGIGFFDDNPITLRAAAHYVESR